ncbi:hypothetical protein IE077_004416 [Cardiosporidium cionae]|uniref:PH domain-containing protein n=1 Tax=Cardiosporidium cionae TaxID=476202 RepID=A0ABQ7JFL1_9APIC|nr:hypothetical protein IE077_004416 [Cardiosporidium cionae]|eukprot:KAF8822774.1 hypothetical protein IE077_004416 [Cardiosporidium cionae]
MLAEIKTNGEIWLPTAPLEKMGQLYEYITSLELPVKRWYHQKANILFYNTPTDVTHQYETYPAELIETDWGIHLLEGCRVESCMLMPPAIARDLCGILESEAILEEIGWFGMKLSWPNAEALILLCGSEEERDDWLQTLSAGTKLFLCITLLSEKLTRQTQSAKRYLCRYRALKHQVQKLKSQIECNYFGQAIRRCDSTEHDRLCERIVMLEDMLDVQEQHFVRIDSLSTATGDREKNPQNVQSWLLTEKVVVMAEKPNRNRHFKIAMTCIDRLLKILFQLSMTLPPPVGHELREIVNKLSSENTGLLKQENCLGKLSKTSVTGIPNRNNLYRDRKEVPGHKDNTLNTKHHWTENCESANFSPSQLFSI